jgi:hypothetical protein
VNSPGDSFVFHSTQIIPPIFPATAATSVTGDITVTLLGVSGGIIPFDTDPRPVIWDPVSQAYLIDRPTSFFTLPLNFSYSIVTGGETYDGLFSVALVPPDPGFGFHLFEWISTTEYPASITVDGLSGSGLKGIGAIGFTAPNDFQLSLSVGGFKNFAAVSPQSGPIVATVVPEPSSVVLFGLGLVGIIRLGKITRRITHNSHQAW